MGILKTLAQAIAGARETLQDMNKRLAGLVQEREALLARPATKASIRAAFDRATDELADSVVPFSRHHFEKHHKVCGGNWFDTAAGLTLLGIPTTAPVGQAPAPTMATSDGKVNAAAYTFIHRDAIKAANARYVDAVYTDMPGAISSEQRAKELAALNKAIAELESEIADAEAELREARRVVS